MRIVARAVLLAAFVVVTAAVGNVVVTKRGSQSTPVLLDGFEAGFVWDAESTTDRAPQPDGDGTERGWRTSSNERGIQS